jgi:hypothetical protein
VTKLLEQAIKQLRQLPAGALAFKRSGDPNMGNFTEATILKSFGEVPTNLDEL